MAFPSDVKGCMRDCILSVMWAKDDIYSFFKNYCTQSDLKVLDNYKEQLTRVGMVDRVFDHLSSRTDGGLGAFRAMLKSLTEWSHFDPYYFDKLKKLNRDEARRKIDHLRQLQEIRDAKIKADRERQEELKRTQQESRQSIEELKKTFLELHSGKMSVQQRGYELEKILLELGRLSELEVTEPFRVIGEQIDGAVKYDGEHYLIEAKWQDQTASNEPVYQFVGKIEGKMYGRGIFVSIHGFSDHVVNSILVGKAIKTVFIDGEDLIYVLEENLSFSKLIDMKVKAAQTRGEIYVHPLTGKSKLP
ncbi:restriction endonuclease [Oculatella sp. FACHB-28]|uniref:restriction endonuclease n=1 Tax=Oculatella sp. FACHB-28 TaxID=2692845 RepID=UPI001689E1AC|nr:restriction endonuclease [Oculatella sp. FACHB-28]MBD2055766.1 restriction endonuclease [Oculatella sp. FACHB-28]